jgi:alpha-N-arabinofuranosidase
MKITFVLLYFFGILVSIGWTQPRITIDVSKPGAAISPTMNGIFFEDINFGADGGLYAELVKNRSFEFPEPLMGWSKLQRQGAEGTLLVRDDDPFITGTAYGEPGNLHYLRIDVKNLGKGFGITNEGFRGIGLREGKNTFFHYSSAVRWARWE